MNTNIAYHLSEQMVYSDENSVINDLFSTKGESDDKLIYNNSFEIDRDSNVADGPTDVEVLRQRKANLIYLLY
jgi:hypothetical protein